MKFTKETINNTLNTKLKETLATMYQDAKSDMFDVQEDVVSMGKITDKEIERFLKEEKSEPLLKQNIKDVEKSIKSFQSVHNRTSNKDYYKTLKTYKVGKKEKDLIQFFLNCVDAFRSYD